MNNFWIVLSHVWIKFKYSLIFRIYFLIIGTLYLIIFSRDLSLKRVSGLLLWKRVEFPTSQTKMTQFFHKSEGHIMQSLGKDEFPVSCPKTPTPTADRAGNLVIHAPKSIVRLGREHAIRWVWVQVSSKGNLPFSQTVALVAKRRKQWGYFSFWWYFYKSPILSFKITYVFTVFWSRIFNVSWGKKANFCSKIGLLMKTC